jgi:hypothetical protein
MSASMLWIFPSWLVSAVCLISSIITQSELEGCGVNLPPTSFCYWGLNRRSCPRLTGGAADRERVDRSTVMYSTSSKVWSPSPSNYAGLYTLALLGAAQPLLRAHSVKNINPLYDVTSTMYRRLLSLNKAWVVKRYSAPGVIICAPRKKKNLCQNWVAKRGHCNLHVSYYSFWCASHLVISMYVEEIVWS